MKMWLSCGSSDVDDLEFEKDTDFGFVVEFDNGERAEITFEPDITGDPNEVHMVRCSMYSDSDALLKREILHGA